MSDRHFEPVFADPPTESDILGHPTEGNGRHQKAALARLSYGGVPPS